MRRRADRQGGQLDEEQRVAAAALDEILDEVVNRRLAVAVTLDQQTNQGAGVGDGEGSERYPQQQRPVEKGRRPEQIVVGALAGDDKERQVGQRANDDGEQVADHRVGPLQVVDQQDRHPRLGMAAHRVGDHAADAVADAGLVELVELGGMAEQVGDDAEQALDQIVAGEHPPQLLGALFDGLADVVGPGLGIEVEQRRQAVAHRRPQARLPVRRARRFDDDRLVGQAGDDVIGQSGLAAARLTDDGNDTAVAAAHQRDRRLEQGQLVEASDERDVATDGAGAGGRGAGDDPRLLDLLAPADLRDPERLASDRRRAQRLGRFPDEHAAVRCQGLESRRRVDHIAHGGVVGPGHRADEHFAGIDADTHLDLAGGLVAVLDVFGDESSERFLHAQGGADSPVGVVLVGDGCAEEGDDGVAEDLVDATAEGLDLGDEWLEVGLDEAGHGLRIEALGERGVADEVGEQHRDDPPFLDRDRRILRRCTARRTEPGT